MRIFKRIKELLVISSLLLVFTACGSKDYFSAERGGIYSGTCNFDTNSENVYIGDIVDSCDYSYGTSYSNFSMYDTYNPEGSVELLVIPSGGGIIEGQYTASAKLTLRGSEYCCTSLGGSNVFGHGIKEEEIATIGNLVLSCQSVSGGSGSYFGGYYQPITLKIGVYHQICSGGGYGVAVLTEDNRLQGVISVSSGSQGLAPYLNMDVYNYFLQ